MRRNLPTPEISPLHLPSPLRAAIFALLVILIVAPAHAGFIEVGASGTYRKSNIDVDAYDESIAYTGSVSYYLNEASALELSYTNGSNKRVISENVANGHVTQLTYKTAGLDFVYTIGARDAILRPYVKIGAQYIIEKRILDQYRAADGTFMNPDPIQDDPGLVPSAGIGFKLGLTENLSLKFGVDGWTSRALNKPPVTVDVFGRGGLSWMF